MWGGAPAVTRSRFGKGQAVYLGCRLDEEGLDALLRQLLPQWGIPLPGLAFPLVVKGGVNQQGRRVDYYFNYSGQARQGACPHPAALSLLDGESLAEDEPFPLEPWGVKILEQAPAGE